MAAVILSAEEKINLLQAYLLLILNKFLMIFLFYEVEKKITKYWEICIAELIEEDSV